MITSHRTPASDALVRSRKHETETTHRARYAAIYARVATQSEHGDYNLARQTDLCQQYCQHHGYTVVHIYKDVASGADMRNRPGLTTLRIAANNHEFDVVVIAAYDRISRNPAHVAALLEELDALGIAVELLPENAESDNRFIHLMHTHLVEQQRERLKLMKRNAQKRKQTPLDTQPEEAALLHILFEYAASGSELSTLATQLTLGEFPTLSRGHLPVGHTQPTSLSETAHNND